MITRIRRHLRDCCNEYDDLLDGPDDLTEESPALVTGHSLVTLLTLLVTVKHRVTLRGQSRG